MEGEFTMTRAEILTDWLLTEVERRLQTHCGRITGEMALALSSLRHDYEILIRDEIDDAQREARAETRDLIDADQC